MYESFEVFCNSILSVRKDRELHPKTIEIIKNVLRELYPNSFVIGEPESVAIGRGDVVGHIDDLTIHIEIIASRNQVRRDVDLLGESIADIRIAVLMDDVIEEKIAETYFRTLRARGLPIRIYPIIKLSKVLVNSNREKFKRCLKKIIETTRSRYFKLLENCYWKWKEFGMPAENSELLIFSKFRHNIEFDIGHKEMIINSILNVEPDDKQFYKKHFVVEDTDREEGIKARFVEKEPFVFFIDPKGEILVEETKKSYRRVAKIFKRKIESIPKCVFDNFMLSDEVPNTLKIQFFRNYPLHLTLGESSDDLRLVFEEIQNLIIIEEILIEKGFKLFDPEKMMDFIKPIFFINEDKLLIAIIYSQNEEELEEQKTWSERGVSEEICYAHIIEDFAYSECPVCYYCGCFTNPLPILVLPTISEVEYSTNYIVSNMTKIDDIFEEILETTKTADTEQTTVYLKSLRIQHSNITCKCGSNSIIPVEFQKCGHLSDFDFLGCRGALEHECGYRESFCDLCEQCSRFRRLDFMLPRTEYILSMNEEVEVLPFCLDCKAMLHEETWKSPNCCFNEFYHCDDYCPLC